MGDLWGYWSDDGLGFLEYLQLAEDIGAEPVWVVNDGIAIRDEVDTELIGDYLTEMLQSIEFARGSPDSDWGSLRASYGHFEPFSLKYVAIGYEHCGKKNYTGTYLRFYEYLKRDYPDIMVISNCDGSLSQPLDHPADLYDVHLFSTVQDLLDQDRMFKNKPIHGPKAFVSEYAAKLPEDLIGNGTFKGALGEAGFLLSIEKNSEVVPMVSYSPLFAHENDIRLKPSAIYFNSNQIYARSSYWVQTLFSDSSGGTLLDTPNVQAVADVPIYYTAISFKDPKDQKNYLRIKVLNYQANAQNLKLYLEGIDPGAIKGKRKIVLASSDLWEDNSFNNPMKVVPQTTHLRASGKNIDLEVEPYSFTAFDLLNTSPAPQQYSSTIVSILCFLLNIIVFFLFA